MSIDTEKESKISHYLGIDYGRSSVGLALADEETRMAFAYDTYKNDKDLLQKIVALAEERNIRKAIIGIPSYVNKETIESEAKRLGSLLEKTLEIEVFYQNEMFTTKMAQANLIEKGAKGINKQDDKEAARIILQEWLNNNQNT